MNIKKIIATALLLIAFYQGWAQLIPLDPNVRTGKLSNGFTYYIRHNEEPKNRVVFYLVNKVGSVLEDDDQQGLAHFMEHMSFNGTKNFPKNQLVDYLQKAGVRFGADLNASTSFDETIYQLPVPSDKPEIVQLGLQIMRDWAQDAILDSTEIEKERGIVMEEMRLGKGAADRLRTKYFPIIVNKSIYASRLPIGIPNVITKFKPSAIQRFYHDWYRPNLQALIVVGDIDVDAIERNIKDKFSDLKNPDKEKPRPAYEIPLTGMNQFIAMTDPEVTATSAELIIKQPKLDLHTVENYRQSIARELINIMIGDRYSEVQRQPNPPYLNAGAAIGGFIANLDNYSLTVTAKPGELENGFKAAWRINEQARRYGFTATELERAKTVYFSQINASWKEKSKTSSEGYVNEYVQHFLKGTAAPGIDFEYALVKDLLPTLSVDELNTSFKKMIKTGDRDILITAPEKDKTLLPTQKAFMSWIAAVEKEKLTAYHEEVSTKNLLDKAPVAGKISKTEYNKALNITTMILSNGVKVLLKPTDFRNDEIIFTGVSEGGTSLYSDADFRSAEAANLIPSFGAGNYDDAAISKYLAGKQFSVRPVVNERQQGINGSSTVEDLEQALQLMYAYFTQPRKDTVLFNNFMARSKAALANAQRDPTKAFNDTVSAVLSNYNVRRAPQTIATIDQIDLDKAFKIYQERFSDASGFTFVFTGSIDTNAIKPLLERYIASLPALDKKEQARDLNLEIPAGKITKAVHRGTEDKASVLLVLSGPFDYSFENELKMDALKENIQIRLLERLREDEGGVYSPRVGVATTKLPHGRFSLTISFGCAPQNVENLIASAMDEISKIRTSGPSQVNLEKFKAETQRSIELQLKSNNFWHNYVVEQLLNSEPLEAIGQYNYILGKMTVADVQETANKYLSDKNFIRIVLLPNGKAQKGSKK
ncbi:M16 family metallopeptidase [Pedobacter sp.]